MATDLSAQIRQAWEHVCRLEYLNRRQVMLTELVSDLDTDLAQLERTLASENRDVARLEGASFSGLMASLSGAKNARLAKERVEAEAVRLRVQGHRNRLAKATENLTKTRAELTTVQNARAEYDNIIRQVQHHELADLGQRLASVEADLWEYEEARSAAKAAENSLMGVLQCLRDVGNASNQRLWQMSFVDAIRFARLGQADQAAWRAEIALDDFTRQLGDIGVETRFELPPADLRWFTTLFFQPDATEQSRHEQIFQTYQQVEAILRWVAGMNEHLGSRQSVLLTSRTRLRTHWENALMS